MLLLLFGLGCRSVGGTEGFSVQSLYLAHKSGTETVETVPGFERSFAGEWTLASWGGGPCREDAEPGAPEGEGWEQSEGDSEDASPFDYCEFLTAIGATGTNDAPYATPSRAFRRALTLQLRDYSEETNARSGSVAIYECRAPDPLDEWEVLYGFGDELVLSEELTDFSIEITGRNVARVQASLDDRVRVDWSVRYCEF